jgi:hypothetical protein
MGIILCPAIDTKLNISLEKLALTWKVINFSHPGCVLHESLTTLADNAQFFLVIPGDP